VNIGLIICGWGLIAIALLIATLWITGVEGMLLFKRWGRTLSLCITVATLSLYVVSGLSLFTGLEGMLF
jgi:hypothetical protein